MTTEGAAGCPKRMTYGPCGGVSRGGECEVPGLRCVFVDAPLVRWTPAASYTPKPGSLPEMSARETGFEVQSGTRGVRGSGLAEVLGAGPGQPVIIVDLPARALDVESLRRTTGLLAGAADAVLLGDHGAARVQLPPSLRAQLVQAEGVRAWAGLNCRDRNRVALEGELAGLAAVGVAGVHCVTGDHPALGHRPDALPVFDLDATRLVALARTAGLTTSVAENPVAPPVELRPGRVAEKARAGTQVCFVNHTPGPHVVARFIEAARRACAGTGSQVEFVACVPVVSDRASADILASFTGLELPHGYLDRILAAPDVEAAGIRQAILLAEALLGVDGVSGVNLSGGARPGDEERVATVMAAVAKGLLG